MSRSTALLEQTDPLTGLAIAVAVADVVCPSCGSRAKQCKRPSGHGASEWHAERVRLAESMLDDEWAIQRAVTR